MYYMCVCVWDRTYRQMTVAKDYVQLSTVATEGIYRLFTLYELVTRGRRDRVSDLLQLKKKKKVSV